MDLLQMVPKMVSMSRKDRDALYEDIRLTGTGWTMIDKTGIATRIEPARVLLKPESKDGHG